MATDTEQPKPIPTATKPSGRQKRKRRLRPCDHCGAMLPEKEHRCTHCGQDVVRYGRPTIVAAAFALGFLLFCAVLYVASLWLRG